MNILIRQYLGANHSWCVVGHGFAKSLKKLGHNVELYSTDGIAHLPNDLKENLIGYCELNRFNQNTLKDQKEYDLGIGYTTMKNFPSLLHGCKKKFGIWCYEWAGKNAIPTGFAKYHSSVDKLLPPSNFAKQVFLDSGIPETSMKVLPHGIDPEEFKQAQSLNLSKKKFKIGVVLGQLHKRKNIKGLLEAYTLAFTNKDDVCLIIKASMKKCDDVDLYSLIQSVNKKNSPEIKIVKEFIPTMADFYASVDATFTMSHCEAFYFPALESLASGILPIAPNYGGQLDFLDSTNSLLINGEVRPADMKSMYWEAKPSVWFEPSVSFGAAQLRNAYDSFEDRNKVISSQREEIWKKYSWDNITNQLLEMV